MRNWLNYSTMGKLVSMIWVNDLKYLKMSKVKASFSDLGHSSLSSQGWKGKLHVSTCNMAKSPS